MSDHTPEQLPRLTDAQCDEFRRLPVSFNDMVRAIHQAGAAAALRAQADAEPWRHHVERRLLTWRQRFVNKSGDQLALDDFMDKESLDDLIDFVCDEYAAPPPAEPAAPALGEQESFEAWCPYRGSPDPRVVWAAAYKAGLAAQAPAALRQQAEPGELPPLQAYEWNSGARDAMEAYARLALAQSPLPKERVERVMALVRHCTAIHRLHVLGHTTDTECSNALAAVRAILEGRQS